VWWQVRSHVFLWLEKGKEYGMSRKKRKENCNKYRKNKGEDYLRVIQGGGAQVQRQRQTKVVITPRNFHQDDYWHI
jgi:hypothetical protein